MRESANKAGIANKQLIIALEPEVAAVFCKQIAVKGDASSLQTFSTGEEFMLIDMGGGTVDITCYEVMNDETLKEIYHPSGGPWGGTMVDEAFISFLKELFGTAIWNSFISGNNNQCARLEIARKFEIKKKAELSSDTMNISLGSSIMEHFEESKGEKFASTLKQSTYNTSVECSRDKLRIQSSIFENMFKEPIDALIEQVERLLANTELQDVRTILLMGGFSESPIVNRRMQEAFPCVNVINPFEAGLAVLKGAVLFGHSTAAISERSSPRTYGICASVPWNPQEHPPRSYNKNEGQEKCTEVFKVMIRRGDLRIPPYPK